MGFFSSLFGGGSSKATQAAAAQAQAFLMEQQADLDRRGQEAGAAALGHLHEGLNLGRDAIGTGYDEARQEYANARDYFTPYAQAGLSALGGYQDALGLNGGGGYDRAVANFRESPGYRFQVDQATDAVARKASALGALGSGNTMAAISDRAGNMADQEWGSWLDRQRGLVDLGYNATGQQAALTRGIGDLGAAEGTSLASLYGSSYGKMADVNLNVGNMGVTSLQNTSNAIANSMLEAGKAKDAARNAGAQNLLGGILGLGSIGARIVTAPLTGGTSLLGRWL